MMFNQLSNTAFNNKVFSFGTIRAMESSPIHPSTVRLYHAALALRDVSGQSAVARLLNVSPQTVKNWEARGISKVGAIAAQNVIGCSASWLVLGKGEMIAAGSNAEAIDLDGNQDYPAIRRVRFKLSAGASGFGVDFVDDDAAPIVFQREWFEGRGFTPGKLFAVKVINGSMEPGLHDGDVVVVNTGDTMIKDGEVYAMNYEGELVIKRVVRDAGQWWLASDNPDQRRHPRKVCTDDVFCVGRIVHKQSERI